MGADLIVIGAGVSGLACARELAVAGAKVIVLEQARGVGGRCATHRHEGQPIDFGSVFLHGSDPDLLASLESVEGATPVRGWPVRVEGEGPPCQPAAFKPDQRRVAFEEGVTAWPKSLASGLDVRLEVRATRIEPRRGVTRVLTEAGEEFEARDVVLALPSRQALDLLGPLEERNAEVRGVRGLLGMMAASPCLTLLAAYPIDAPAPAWDVLYPEESRILQVLAHDAAKRRAPRLRTIVFQALPCWSRLHLEKPETEWSREVLDEAARWMGSWAARPLWSRPHVWRWARADGGSELAGPVLFEAAPGSRIGLAGEVFAEGGGVQAAFLSGRRLAARLLGDAPPRGSTERTE